MGLLSGQLILLFSLIGLSLVVPVCLEGNWIIDSVGQGTSFMSGHGLF